MPQLDKYIFLNQVLALIFFFFLIYIYIRGTVIPNLNMSLKYRHKRFATLFSHDRGNWSLFKETNSSISRRAVKQLNFINQHLNNVFTQYKLKYKVNFILLLNTYFNSKHLFVLLKLLSTKNKSLNDYIQNNFWFYKKYNTVSLSLVSIFSNKNFFFFSQEQFNLFLIKEIVRSHYLIQKVQKN